MEDPVLTLANPLTELNNDSYSTKLMYDVVTEFFTDNDQFKLDAERQWLWHHEGWAKI